MNALLVCETTIADAEIVSVLLFEAGALAVGEVPIVDSLLTVELHAGFNSEENAVLAAEVLGARPWRIETVEPTWIESQKDALKPITVGALCVRAPWHKPSGNPIPDVVIDPGAAFGHGGHPTTRLMLETLVERNLRESTVLDVGTGTGVLAIVAARSGARVVAMDTDPVAIAQAQLNLDRNAMTHAVTLLTGSVELGLPESIDLALVNVTIDQQRIVARRLQDVRVVLLSGILTSQEDDLVALYPGHRLASRQTDGEWVCVGLTQLGQNQVRET